jgi:hypothetical protein
MLRCLLDLYDASPEYDFGVVHSAPNKSEVGVYHRDESRNQALSERIEKQ